MMPFPIWVVVQLMLEVLIAVALARAGGTTVVVSAEPRITIPIQVVRGENSRGALLCR
jgi:hypothetical protein